MKAIARLGAGFSFAACFLAGVLLLSVALPSPHEDRILPIVIGLFLVGLAFFAGTFLWLLGEKWSTQK